MQQPGEQGTLAGATIAADQQGARGGGRGTGVQQCQPLPPSRRHQLAHQLPTSGRRTGEPAGDVPVPHQDQSAPLAIEEQGAVGRGAVRNPRRSRQPSKRGGKLRREASDFHRARADTIHGLEIRRPRRHGYRGCPEGPAHAWSRRSVPPPSMRRETPRRPGGHDQARHRDWRRADRTSASGSERLPKPRPDLCCGSVQMEQSTGTRLMDQDTVKEWGCCHPRIPGLWSATANPHYRRSFARTARY